MTRIDPLSNIGTSRVFRQLCPGPKNPKRIADSLGIKPPPVIEQLRRLQELGVVKLGQKVGRDQNYEIDWKAFMELFIDRAFALESPDASKHRSEIVALKENRIFKDLVKDYVCKTPFKLLFVMQEFGRGIRYSKLLAEKREFKENEMKVFLDRMRLWQRLASEEIDICSGFLESCLQETFGSK